MIRWYFHILNPKERYPLWEEGIYEGRIGKINEIESLHSERSWNNETHESTSDPQTILNGKKDGRWENGCSQIMTVEETKEVGRNNGKWRK